MIEVHARSHHGQGEGDGGMPPSSRSQVSQSQSLVLSHSSLLPASSQQAEGETFASASTATLPLRYRISLAVPPCDFPPSLKEAHAHYVRGEEYLSDAWRRIGEEEGLLDKRKEELRNGRAVRPVGRGVEFASPGAVPGAERGPLWFTASFRIPCLCQIPRFPCAFTPARPPLCSFQLTPLPAHPFPRQIPRFGDDLPPWSPALPPVDLDPDLDELEDFGHSWQEADGCGRGRRRRHPSCDGLFSIEYGHGVDETAAESVEARRRRKGKGREDGSIRLQLAVNPILSTDFDRSTPQLEVPSLPEHRDSELVAQSKRRKAWWRNLIRSSPSFGQIFTILPRPHSYDPLFAARGKRKRLKDVPLDYILPRFFTTPTTPTTPTHPFHPDLSHYIRHTPGARVHWVIPIHGPVIVPTWSDPITETEPIKGGPTPSSGHLSDHLPAPEQKRKPAILPWTSELLRHFMSSFLIPLHKRDDQPFGAISIRLSGPKPDPFIALTPPPPLVSHQHTPPGKQGTTPARVDAGDHVRVYCDARYALGLRTWLYGIEVDRAVIKAGTGMFRPFDKVRLVLAGERGEVLIVA